MTESGFKPGDHVMVGDIEGVIEEVIFGRAMLTRMVLVRYWHQGEIIFQRFHEGDCRAKAI